MGDTFWNPGPVTDAVGDSFVNNRDGDIWFDVLEISDQDIAWDIQNVFLQTVAWHLLKGNFQDTAWEIYLNYTHYIELIYANPVCFNFTTADGEYLGVPVGQTCSIAEPTIFNIQLAEPLKFTFIPQEVTVEQISIKPVCFDFKTASGEYLGVPINPDITLLSYPEFNVQIMKKIKFTFVPQNKFLSGQQ